MAQLISVSVDVGISCKGRDYGKFRMVPFTTSRGGPMTVDFWRILRTGRTDDFNDVLIVEIIPKALLSRVCRETFEEDDEDGNDATLPVKLTIDEETWTYRMRARELEPEEVHYEIEIEEEWYRLSETFVMDLITGEQMAIGERVVSQTIGFGFGEDVMEEMA